MDRNHPLPVGVAVRYRNRIHRIGLNNVDLLSLRCGESAWRRDLVSQHENCKPCEKCHDETHVPWYITEGLVKPENANE